MRKASVLQLFYETVIPLATCSWHIRLTHVYIYHTHITHTNTHTYITYISHTHIHEHTCTVLTQLACEAFPVAVAPAPGQVRLLQLLLLCLGHVPQPHIACHRHCDRVISHCTSLPLGFTSHRH